MINEIRKGKNSVRAEASASLFKTGKGEYGEGDKFLGLTMPECRTIAKKYIQSPLEDVEKLLNSQRHEERMVGLLIIVYKFEKASEKDKKTLYDFYISHLYAANNWDLVDVTVPQVIGRYLLDKDWSILKKLAKSQNLWEKRTAILATFAFIYNGKPEPTLEIAKILLEDKHDLIHKAVGWMLREVGKRCSQKSLTDFLDIHYHAMPRTMLRYAIERFDDKLKRKYLE